MRVICNATLQSKYFCDDCEKKLDEKERKNTVYDDSHFCDDCAESRYMGEQERNFTTYWEG